MTSAVLRFPGHRLASFTCSFGAARAASYEVVGTKASLRLDPAFGIAEELVHHLARGRSRRRRVFPPRDQFAAEILYFSDCVIRGRAPEPSGEEGLADVRVLRALQKSAESGRPVRLSPFERDRRPDPGQEIRRPPSEAPELVGVRDPSPGS
jgi:glucose-fructose oxidoreductase